MFGKKQIVWVNVDKPTKKCTIHAYQDCTFVKKWVPQMPTKWKTLGLPLGRDGGWVKFDALEKAEDYCKKEYPRYLTTKHC